VHKVNQARKAFRVQPVLEESKVLRVKLIQMSYWKFTDLLKNSKLKTY